jgi:HD superfamily phosphohydrolase
LLSGALDPDKLDYLTRDAYFTGVPYGKQDYSYIISHLTVTKDGKNALLFQAEGSLEQILFSKYQMYKAVYWHERVRSATSMIKKSLFTCLKDGTLEPEQLYALDDYSFYSLAQGKKQQLSNVLDVTFGKLLPCIMEHPYQKNGVLESHCKDIYRRDDLENALCDKLRKQHPELRRDQIIIDTAEPISFEADIPLVLSDGSTVSFSSHDALFSADVKARFISALRKTRIFAPSYIQKSEMEQALANV